MKRLNADFYIGIALDALCVWFWVLAGSFRNPDAAIWPKVIIVVLALLSTVLALRGYLKGKKAAEAKHENYLTAENIKGLSLAVVIMILYAAGMGVAGFFISTAVFLPLSMYLLGQRNWIAMLATTVGVEIFVWFLFVYELKLRMP